MTVKAKFAAFVFLAACAASASAQSADLKVSALSDAAPADGTELLYVAQLSAAEGSRSQKLDIDDLSAYVLDLIGLTSASTVCQQDGTGCPAAGAGSVTSVALTVPSFLAVAGSPVTTSGTLAVTLANQNANTVQAGPTTGAAAAPTFRALVAADIPTPLTSSTSGNAGTATALAANPSNCSAGSGAGGIAADGSAEDCTAYLTGITGEELADLSDVSAKSGTGTVVVTTTGAQTSGDCVEIDASGNHIASGAACGGGGGGGDLWEQTTSTNVGLDVNGDADIDAYIESPNATRLRLKQEGANASGRADAASIELRHLAAGYGARIGIDNNAADLFIDVESASAEKRNALYIAAATGRVGLGTASPSQRLHVANAGAAFGLFDNTSNSVAFGFGSGTVASFIESNTDLLILRAASYGAVGSGVGTEVARFTANGLPFDDLASGTNTTAAMVVGSGASLAASGTGTIDASGVDADGDGTRELSTASTRVNFDPDDDGVVESYIDANGDLSWGDTSVNRAGAGGVDIENGSGSYGYLRMTGSQHFQAGTMKILIDPGAFFESEIRMASDIELAWTSSTTASAGTIDARIGRAGVGVVRVDGGAATTGAVLAIQPLATAPATCTAYRDLYTDTSGALCWCSATNTWSVVTGGGTCV